MKSVLRYNFKLRPGNTAKKYLWEESCRCRYLWNQLVERADRSYRAFKDGEEGESLVYGDLSAWLTNQRNENEWLREGSSVVSQQTVRNWASTYWKFFKIKRGRPRFKSAKRSNPSLEYTSRAFRIKDGRLCLPNKTSIPVVWSRDLPSIPKSCIVFRDNVGDWFVSFVVEVNEEPLAKNDSAVGIDWGVKETAILSDSSSVAKSTKGKDNQDDLKKAQRKLSRCKNGSKKRAKRKRLVAIIGRKVARQRKDEAYKWAKSVVEKNHYIAIEDFKPKFLAKSKMAKQAADNAISTFKNILISKAERAGRVIALVDPAYTTMTCSQCGTRAKARIDLSIRTFCCHSCGYSDTRDGNAAKTILVKAGFNLANVDVVRPVHTSVCSRLTELGIPVL